MISADAVRLVTNDAGTPGNGGIGWWSNNAGRCRQAPKDAFWGLGAGHQVLVVIPSLNLIAVRNGATMQAESDWDGAFYGGLLAPLVETIAKGRLPNSQDR